MGVSVTNAVNSDQAKVFAKEVMSQPTGIIHQAKGFREDFHFRLNGGLKQPSREFDAAGLLNPYENRKFWRYGKDDEKIAARFVNPEGKLDAFGRPLHHSLVVPKHLAKGINNIDDVVEKIWPLIKKEHQAYYEEDKAREMRFRA